MNKIILNVVDKKADFARRVVIETSIHLQNCDFITIGDELMFDRDTDFFTFGFESICRTVILSPSAMN